MLQDDPRERLSALADGDLSGSARAALIVELAADVALRGRWRRYHLIGDVLRGERVAQDVAARVREAIAAEPVVLAPRRLRDRSMPRWLLPVAGLAAAASLGAMAVLFLPRGEVGIGPVAPGLAGTPVRQLEIVRRDPIPSGPHGRIDDPALEHELQRYLTVHSDYAASGLKGPLPLAPLLVGYGAGR